MSHHKTEKHHRGHINTHHRTKTLGHRHNSVAPINDNELHTCKVQNVTIIYLFLHSLEHKHYSCVSFWLSTKNYNIGLEI